MISEVSEISDLPPCYFLTSIFSFPKNKKAWAARGRRSPSSESLRGGTPRKQLNAADSIIIYAANMV
jgi:hypothetical protein